MESEVDGTKIVPDLQRSLIEYVKTKVSEKIKANTRPIGQYKGQDIYQFGDSETGYVVLYNAVSAEVLYFVRYRRIRHNGFRLGRQVLVWRNVSHYATTGFAKHVFFKLLLPKFGALVADKEQTENGKKFWGYAIEEALDRNLKVYALDRRSRQTQLVELHTATDVIKWSPILWGTSSTHLLTFAVISLKPLALKKRT